MGAPKQKWTGEEEAALRAAVEKHGAGKWRCILKDPQFASCLAARSNVDLKDKWRNLNVGSGGQGSRSLKIYTKRNNVTMIDEPIAAVPTACLSPDTLFLTDAPRRDQSYSQSIGYENLVVEAIHRLKDPNGSSLLSIAKYIEACDPVPSNFRRLLGIKLREMVLQGILMKSMRNFKVNDANFHPGVSLPQEADSNRQMLKICGGGEKASTSFRTIDHQCLVEGRNGNTRHIMHQPYKNVTHQPAMKRHRVDVDYAGFKLRTIETVAIAASMAILEAEAAATAAEQAFWEAEAAEVEAEAAEIAAEIAALAARTTNQMPAVVDKLAVTG